MSSLAKSFSVMYDEGKPHEVGEKHDEGKPDWSLLPIEAVEEIVKVLTHGAQKYSPDNWKLVDKKRYLSALYRHLASYQKGETADEETDLHPLAHAGCCLLFMLYKELKNE